MDLGNIFEGELVGLLIAGAAMLVVARTMKKGRLEDENPGVSEKILWAVGLLITVSAIIVSFSRGCLPVAPEQDEQKTLREFEQSSGCGPKGKKLKDYKN